MVRSFGGWRWRLGPTGNCVPGPGICVIRRDGRLCDLHVHRAFSCAKEALSIARSAKLAIADHMPALAITDSNNLFGALEFSEKLAKEGIQPIIGIELTLDFGDGARLRRAGAKPPPGAQRLSSWHRTRRATVT